MTMREQINERIEAYAKAVRDRRAETVSQLFAERFDHIAHGAGLILRARESKKENCEADK